MTIGTCDSGNRMKTGAQDDGWAAQLLGSSQNAWYFLLSLRTEPVPDLIRESAIHDPAEEKSWFPGAEIPDLIRGRDDRG